MNIKEKNIELFNNYINKYIKFFGLYDWEISIMEQEKKEAKASIYYDDLLNDGGNTGMMASICYSKDWIENEELNEMEIKRTAFHEILELLLSELGSMANNNEIYISSREIEKEIHRIIRILENTILKEIAK